MKFSVDKQLMHSSVEALFEYTRSQVNEQDILDFSPNDPGYPRYVEAFTKILHSGTIPEKSNFYLSETIGLTGWVEAKKEKNPERFLRYRRFTTAIGIALLHLGNDSEIVRPANYLARDLIIDLDRTSPNHLALLREVSLSSREMLKDCKNEEEYPFFTFASLILSQVAQDWSSSEAAASQLLEDEQDVRNNEDLNWMIEDDRFLLGLTNYDQLHRDWISFANELQNPNAHEDTQLVIDALRKKLKKRHKRDISGTFS